MFKWLPVLKSQGPVPDGAIVIKEEYLDTDPTSRILFWSGMIRDSSLWWDGWYWAVVGTESSEPPVRAVPATTGCAEAVFSTNGPTSINCIGCHGSAISTAPGAGTFSTSQFIGSTSSAAPAQTKPGDGKLPGLPPQLHMQTTPRPARGVPRRLPTHHV